MDKYLFENRLLMVICIAVMIILTVVFLLFVLDTKKEKKYKNVIFPVYKVEKSKKGNNKFTEDDSGKKSKTHKKFGLKSSLLNLLVKKGLDKKIKSWYVQGGNYTKTLEDFVADILKFLLYAVGIAICLQYVLGNILITILASLLVFALPIIDLYGNIQDRRNAFRRDFPYFLQTLAFVLANGSNMSVAFYEVVNKQNEGVLKEVMLDVITTQRVNGGDFTTAFASIIEKVNIDETREFVEIVQNNLEKGVSVAETFTSQSETIARFSRNKKIKKIKAVSNKILIPILIVIMGLALFFI